MIVAIDTSSLLSLVRYYLPFDKNNVLYDNIKVKILHGEILLLDKVIEECQYTSQGIVLKSIDYLKEKKTHIKTIDLLPSKKFFNQLENNFCNASWKNQLTPAEFENRKNAFLESADAKLLLYCLKYKGEKPLEKITIISEESEASNDNKAFKKLPAICKMLDIEIITLPDLLKLYDDINVEFK